VMFVPRVVWMDPQTNRSTVRSRTGISRWMRALDHLNSSVMPRSIRRRQRRPRSPGVFRATATGTTLGGRRDRHNPHRAAHLSIPGRPFRRRSPEWRYHYPPCRPTLTCRSGRRARQSDVRSLAGCQSTGEFLQRAANHIAAFSLNDSETAGPVHLIARARYGHVTHDDPAAAWSGTSRARAGSG